ncbi:Biopolymer transport protein ExbD/TolR [Anatilimnocola aggregata]|uniref:Biopolymer transport protein ExbD/TolR n=1 Tax=Anatilimnocola aggregata TaxID=2528021 RepID=A0A517YEI8_9BACT|nr:biopolymer transporter ExbD [Anatilimnocola aggregata]QDU28637.1 Biopolymer transport protein ExbD/TolR [Anatilimnocola aggregata]
MRRPSPFTQRRDPVDIKMTPMIDVVFLLLIYFIWSASFGIVERLLPSQLSAQAPGTGQPTTEVPPPPEADFEKVVVRVTGTQGRVGWLVNDTPVASLAQLQGILVGLSRIKSDAPVVLHPDPHVPLGDVIDVFDLSRLIGFEKVQFAVDAG